MSGGGSDFVQGFKYLFGIHMGVCRGPIDELIEIKVGDKTAWRGSSKTNETIQINKENLFGGEKGEGGIKGPLMTLFGEADQVAPPELGTVLKTPMPGFRRRFTMFFDGIVSMMNPYPKPWTMRVRRALKGWDGEPWYPEKAVIALYRPMSAGEVENVEGTLETAMVTRAFTHTFPPHVEEAGPPSEGPWIFTFVPEGETLLTIQSVYRSRYNEDDKTYTNTTLVEGVDYTIDGYEITLYRVFVPPDPNASPDAQTDGYYTSYNGVTVAVGYEYERTTIDPTTANDGIGEALIKAMNPVHILYECITNREWGRGLHPSNLDDAVWRYAADQCHEEQFGLCLKWDRTSRIDDFIKTVINHVGGFIFDDRITGKLKIILTRSDYRKEDLQLFDKDSGLMSISENTVSSLGGTINEVKVQFTDPVTNKQQTQRAVNLASWHANAGAVNSRTLTFEGVPTALLASKIAKRELRAMSPDVRRFTIKLDRRGYFVTPGCTIRVQDTSRGIADTVLRVVHVDYGKLGAGEIEVKAALDIYGMPQRGFTTIGPPTWEPPDTAKPCVGLTHAFEAPYRSIYRYTTAANLATIDPAAAFLAVVAQEGKPVNTTFSIAVRDGAPESEDEPPDDSYVCPI